MVDLLQRAESCRSKCPTAPAIRMCLKESKSTLATDSAPANALHFNRRLKSTKYARTFHCDGDRGSCHGRSAAPRRPGQCGPSQAGRTLWRGERRAIVLV